jgi:tetratricopeptide (TPR) repeat protein
MISVFFIALIFGFSNITFAQEESVVMKDPNAVKELFFAGLKDKLNENYASASVSFSKILAIDPNNDAAHFEIANAALRQNKLADADISIRRALALKPVNSWYLKLQTEILKRNGNIEALVQTLNKLIEIDGENESYYFDKANAQFILGKKEEAQKDLDYLEQKFGPSKASKALKARFNPKNVGNNNSSEEMPQDVKRYLDISGALIEKKQFEEALKVLQKAKDFAPDNYELNLATADVYQLQRRLDESFSELKKAFVQQEMPLVEKIKILNQMLGRFSKPGMAKYTTDLALVALDDYKDDPKLNLLYGDILYQQGNLSSAVAQYKSTLKIGEQNYSAWEKLLGVQTLMGSYAEAIVTSDEALSLYPNQAILYYYRAFALHRSMQNAEAALELKNALQLDPDDQNLKAMILALQAEVFIDQSKFKEANAAFDKAVNLAPNNFLTMSNYAYYLALRNHDLPKAETLAKKAATALPQNSSVLDTYAMVLFKLGKFDEAIKYIEQALQNNEGDNPVYLEHYGDILFSKGRKEEAVSQWQKSKAAGNQSEKLMRKINEKKYIK